MVHYQARQWTDWGMRMNVAAATLNNMTTNNTGRSGPGRRVAARLTYLGKSGPDVEAETNGAIYEKLLSEIRTGKKQLKNLPYSKLRHLMFALEWSPDEFAIETGIEMPTASIPNSKPYAPHHEVPVYETVAAGLASTPSEDEVVGVYYLDPSLAGLRGRNVESMVVVTVNGDSMASPDVLKDIPDGSMVVVELGARPREGDVVVAWIEAKDVAVLKRYGPDHHAILTSYKPDGPVFRASEHDIDIRGVVRQMIRKF